MPAPKITMGFMGTVPRMEPELIPDNAAQRADNCALWHGDLRPLRAPGASVFTPTKPGVKKSIYKIGIDLPDNQYWLTWATEVYAIRGPIADDISERTYFMGDGPQARMTTLPLASQNGTDYPVVSYAMGVPPPADAPVMSVTGIEAGDKEVTRTYCYTYVTSFGEEGPPSPFTEITFNSSLTAVVGGMAQAPAGPYSITSKRIYRSQGGTQGAAFRFVAEVPITTAEFTDTIADASLGDEMVTLEFDPPPEGAFGLISGPGGMATCFKGKNIYQCEPFYTYAWPEKYRSTIPFEIVGGVWFASSLLVCTKGKPYLLTGVEPAGLSEELVDLDEPCVSARTIVSTGTGGIYASMRGLVYVGAGGSRILTEALFEEKAWAALNPKGMRGWWWHGRYVCAFAEGGGFVLYGNDQTLTFFDDVIQSGHIEEDSGDLWVCIDNEIRKFDAGALRTYHWKSKRFLRGGQLAPTCARIEAKGEVTFTFTGYDKDGQQTRMARKVSDAQTFRLPPGRFLSYEWEVTGTSIVLAVFTAESPGDMNAPV